MGAVVVVVGGGGAAVVVVVEVAASSSGDFAVRFACFGGGFTACSSGRVFVCVGGEGLDSNALAVGRLSWVLRQATWSVGGRWLPLSLSLPL